MATLREIVDSLDNFIESASGLNISCIKGYPNFRNPQLNPPLAALFYQGSSQAAQVRRRIGASTKPVGLTLGIYATDEINLLGLVDLLHDIRERQIILTAGSDSQKVEVRLGDDERAVPEADDPDELRYFVTCPVVLSYE